MPRRRRASKARDDPRAPLRKASGDGKPLTVYFSGPLFDTWRLIGNDALAREIERRSRGRYAVVLPQRLPSRAAVTASIDRAKIDRAPTPACGMPSGTDSVAALAIREEELSALLAADAILASFDGPGLDAGTVAEFVTAKMADKPAVLLRTDLRPGDRLSAPGGPEAPIARPLPFNLTLLGWPRTRVVWFDALGFYREHGDDPARLLRETTRLAVRALDRVVRSEPVRPRASPSAVRALTGLPSRRHRKARHGEAESGEARPPPRLRRAPIGGRART